MTDLPSAPPTGDAKTDYWRDQVRQKIDEMDDARTGGPGIESARAVLSENGEVLVIVMTNGSTGSVKVAASTSDFPSDSTVDGKSAINTSTRRAVSGALITATPGDTVYISAIAYEGSGGLGDSSATFYEQTKPTGAFGTPVESTQLSISGNVGTLTLLIYDPNNLVTKVEFKEKSGRGSFSAFAEDASAPYTSDVTLVEKHPSHIAYKITYTTPDGGSDTIEGVVTFDVDDIAIVGVETTSFDSTSMAVRYSGDDDTASIWRKDLGAADSTATKVGDGRTASELIALTSSKQSFEAAGKNDDGDFGPWIEFDVPALITGDSVDDGTLIASKLTESSQHFGFDATFSASDENTVAWTSGTLQLADGSSHSINSGNTGDMASGTWIYFDPDTSTTALQTTTTTSTAIGERKIVVCYAKPAADSSQNAFFVPSVGVFGLNEENISPNSISTDRIQANAITAAKISVAQLSALSADVGTLTAGLIENASGSRFIDLDATGSSAWIKSSNFELRADGTAIFSGDAGSATYTSGNTLDGREPAEAGAVKNWSTLNDDGGKPADNADVTANSNQAMNWLTGVTATGYQVGLLADRPAAGTANRFYLATDAGTNSNGVLYRDTGSSWVKASINDVQDAANAGNLAVLDVIDTTEITDDAITTPKIFAGAVTAAKISVSDLSAIKANIGEITAGWLGDASPGSATAAIRLTGTATMPSENFIDFTASGNDPWLKHSGLELQADGDATFSGTVSADQFTASTARFGHRVIVGDTVGDAIHPTITALTDATDNEGLKWVSNLGNLQSKITYNGSTGKIEVRSGNSSFPGMVVFASDESAPSSGGVVNVVHHGTGTASSIGVEGTLHTEDA